MASVSIPLLSMGMSEGKIVEWFVADGAAVTEGQPLYAVEFEKSVMDIEAPASGRLTQMAAVGDVCPVGTQVAEIAE
jgi:pyruvate/2-oxoglutarate dehydrogenase complex dihydrolipoamide acyltransferase (E2) component